MKISKAAYTHIGGRRQNEDSVSCQILGEDCVFAVVADGVGGHGDGNIASAIAVRQLSRCVQCQELPTQAQILEWMQDANREILESNRTPAGMKTTAVFLAVCRDAAIWAHIGDSRLYHLNAGSLEHYTNDHSIPQVQVIAGELTRAQIPFSPDRNKILRALGSDEIKPEFHPVIQLTPGRHAFLMCTDGFWEYLTDEEIQMDLLKSDSPESWLSYLRCRGDGRKDEYADNNSAVAIFVDV